MKTIRAILSFFRRPKVDWDIKRRELLYRDDVEESGEIWR